MAAGTDRSRRTLRWILICLAGLGLVWAAPAAAASAHEQGPTAHHAELVHSIVLAGTKSAAPSARTSPSLHQLRSVDAALHSAAPTTGHVPAVAAQSFEASSLTRTHTRSTAPRAPPFEGLA
jgi:hypothetical protein